MRGQEQRNKRTLGANSTRRGKWHLYLGGIIILHIVLGALYWYYTPFGASPDEKAHGAYIHSIVAERRLPVFSAADRENYEAHQPPLYYLLGVLFYQTAKSFGSENPIEAVRLLSLILGALSILVTYRVVKMLFPEDEGLSIACAGFVAFLPMHLTLSVSVSNDMLTELLFGVGLLLMTRILTAGSTSRNMFLLGCVLGLGLLTKTTCVILFPLAVLTYIFAWRLEKDSHIMWQLAGIFGVSLIIGGWWLLRNKLLYGDFFGVSEFAKAFEQTARPQYWLHERGLSLGNYVLLVCGWTFASFWGVFGHMRVFMATWIYFLLGLATLASGIALAPAISYCIKGREEVRTSQVIKYSLMLYGATLLLVLVAFVTFNFKYFQAQGRYLYPALIPISLFWVLGIRQVFPSSVRKFAPSFVIICMLSLAFYALVGYVAPLLAEIYGVL